ncbi:hypothetical protein WJX73_000504 [Symbiochloris irregularis]|uniref:TNFR-Cys domain-containing protein n=1 Tax=Symbiochloris irregularis TaxID=706552 RepID=A0AAW1NNX3_9CHLO
MPAGLTSVALAARGCLPYIREVLSDCGGVNLPVAADKRAQLAVPAGQSNSTWLTIGGAFAGIGIGVVVLICFLMVCFDRRRHSQGNRRVAIRRPLADLRPAIRQPQNVSIPVVVVSPSGGIELAKSVSPEDFAVRPGDGQPDCHVKGSEIIIVTHGEPAFAEADVMDMHHKLGEDFAPTCHPGEPCNHCPQCTADEPCSLKPKQQNHNNTGCTAGDRGNTVPHGDGVRSRDDTAGEEYRIEITQLGEDDAHHLDANSDQHAALAATGICYAWRLTSLSARRWSTWLQHNGPGARRVQRGSDSLPPADAADADVTDTLEVNIISLAAYEPLLAEAVLKNTDQARAILHTLMESTQQIEPLQSLLLKCNLFEEVVEGRVEIEVQQIELQYPKGYRKAGTCWSRGCSQQYLRDFWTTATLCATPHHRR